MYMYSVVRDWCMVLKETGVWCCKRLVYGVERDWCMVL